jgi:F-type H+-transporting ATPase subunit epsilon
MMHLQVIEPTRTVVDATTPRIVAEALNGSLGLLPRHADFVTALAPGILTYESDGGIERHVAVDEGLLVKIGETVLVSTPHAVAGDALGTLRRRVEESFVERDEHQRRVRGAAARLEADLVRRFVELE